MTANPYSESDIIAQIRADGISTNDISDDNVLIQIDRALDRYLFFKPKVCITTGSTCITTVADQPNYAKPTSALWIKSVLYQPQYNTDELEDLWQEVLLSNVQELDPSMLMLDYGKLARLHRLFAGSWTERNDQIWLLPTPQTSGDKVAVIYADDRTLDELDQIKDTRFYELVRAFVLRAVGTKKLTGGGWRAGQFALTGQVGQSTLDAGNKALKEVESQLANSFVAARS